jgi:hypothetical protein
MQLTPTQARRPELRAAPSVRGRLVEGLEDREQPAHRRGLALSDGVGRAAAVARGGVKAPPPSS